MNTLLVAATQAPVFGYLAGLALVILSTFIGVSILTNGWPKFRK